MLEPRACQTRPEGAAAEYDDDTCSPFSLKDRRIEHKSQEKRNYDINALLADEDDVDVLLFCSQSKKKTTILP